MLYKLLLATVAPAVVFGDSHAEGETGHDDHADDDHAATEDADHADDHAATEDDDHADDGPQTIQLNWAVASDVLLPMTLCTGDTIKFKWTSGFHDVWLFENGKDDYDSCVMPSNAYTLVADGQQPIAPLDVSGEADYVVKSGTEYFTCSVVGHCEEGQKVIITGVDGADCVRDLGSAVGGGNEAPAEDDHSGHAHGSGADDDHDDDAAGNGSFATVVSGIFASVVAVLMF